jgi:hypothetical protein
MSYLVTSNEAVLEEKDKKVSSNQRSGWPGWVSNHSEKQRHLLRTSRGLFLPSLVTSHVAVLEKKSKISLPIRSQEAKDSNFGFLIALKKDTYNSSSEPLEEQLWQVWRLGMKI